MWQLLGNNGSVLNPKANGDKLAWLMLVCVTCLSNLMGSDNDLGYEVKTHSKFEIVPEFLVFIVVFVF